MFGIQAIWSAVTYNIGVLFIVMANGRYGVMDGQAAARGATPPWPRFPGLEIAALARAMGCSGVRVDTFDEMTGIIKRAVPDLRALREPLLVEVTLRDEA